MRGFKVQSLPGNYVELLLNVTRRLAGGAASGVTPTGLAATTTTEEFPFSSVLLSDRQSIQQVSTSNS